MRVPEVAPNHSEQMGFAGPDRATFAPGRGHRGIRHGMHFLLFYEVVPDYLTRRAPLRAEHLSLVKESHAQGDLVLAGALANPADGAVLVFRSKAAAEAFAAADPYVRHGIVTSFRVREWTTVIGDGVTPPA